MIFTLSRWKNRSDKATFQTLIDVFAKNINWV